MRVWITGLSDGFEPLVANDIDEDPIRLYRSLRIRMNVDPAVVLAFVFIRLLT